MELSNSYLLDIAKVGKSLFDAGNIDDKLRSVIFYKDPPVVLIRNSYAGLIYFHDFILDHEFSILSDVFSSFIGLFSLDPVTKVSIKKSISSWEIGKFHYKSGLMEVPEFSENIPDADSFIPLSTQFIALVNKAEFSASTDVRQQKIYGVYVDAGNIISCDNVRAYLSIENEVIKDIENLFISKEMLAILNSTHTSPEAIAQDGKRTWFLYKNFMSYFSLFGGSYPKVKDSFNIITSKDKIGDVFGYISKDIESLRMATKERFGNILQVTINSQKMKLSVKAEVSGEEFILETEVQTTPNDLACELKINLGMFIDGLLRFSNFSIFDDSLYFKDSESEHIIMLMR